MPVFLNSGGKVVLKGGGVAIDASCCCAEQGACCANGDCTVGTQSECDEAEGEYQGDGTTCEDENIDCNPTGACCALDSDDCTIERQTDCTDIVGGNFQGADSVCEPNPCPDCTDGFCGFLNPDDGLYYHTKTYTNTVDNSTCPPDGFCDVAYPESCADPGCNNIWNICNSVVTIKTRHIEVLTSESVADCLSDIVETNETLSVDALCTYAVFIDGSGCDLSCGDTIGDNTCPGFDPDTDPTHYSTCGTINTEISYSGLDPCQPLPPP
jgi:hypothetical protein